MVPEIMIGSSKPNSSKTPCTAKIGGLGVVFHQFVEGHVAVAGVVHVRRQRAGTAGRAQYAGHEARPVRGFQGFGVGHLARQTRAFHVQLVDQRLHAVVGLGHLGGVEGVGFENVGASIQVGFLDRTDHIRTREHQQVIVALYIARPVGETFATVVLFLELVALDHGAHAAIKNQNTFFEGLLKSVEASTAVGHGTT